LDVTTSGVHGDTASVKYKEQDTTSNVTVRVTASDGTRAGMAYMLVDTVQFDRPMVRALRAVSATAAATASAAASGDLAGITKLNTKTALHLTSTVGYKLDIALDWIVSPNVRGLERSALTPLALFEPRPFRGFYHERDVHLKLPPHTLAPRTLYTFTLSAVYNGTDPWHPGRLEKVP
jgi:hypothetical protein